MIDSINSNVKVGGCKAGGGFTLKIFGPSLPYSTNYYLLHLLILSVTLFIYRIDASVGFRLYDAGRSAVVGYGS